MAGFQEDLDVDDRALRRPALAVPLAPSQNITLSSEEEEEGDGEGLEPRARLTVMAEEDRGVEPEAKR